MAMLSANCIIAITRFFSPDTVPLIDQVLKLKPIEANTKIVEATKNAKGTNLGMVSVRTGAVGSVVMMIRMGARFLRARSLRRRFSSGAMAPAGEVNMLAARRRGYLTADN